MAADAHAPQAVVATAPRGLAFSHWRYLFLDNGLGAAFLNLGINGVIAWMIFKDVAVVPLWGTLGIAVDTIATSVILPVITCVVVTALTRWHVRAGRLPPLPAAARAHFLIRRLPASTAHRAAFAAVASLLLLVPVTLAGLVWLQVGELSFRDFLIFKVAFAVADGVVVTPPLAFAALAHAGPIDR